MIRIGHAWDTHRLVKDRDLYLGGLKIENEYGLLGHSDADVVLHAVAESLLGSLALGDLGYYYPDNSLHSFLLPANVVDYYFHYS